MLALPILWTLSTARAQAQQWSVDVYAGGTRYGAVSALSDAVGVVANLRATTPRFSAFAAAAAPLNAESPAWGSLGADARLTRTVGIFEIGASIAADGFVFRQQDRTTGAGASAQLLPLIGLSRGGWSFEVGGGRRMYGLTHDDRTVSRHVHELAARAATTFGPFSTAAGVRSLPDGDPRHFAGVQAVAGSGRLRGWASAGQWFGAADDTEWGFGASFDAGGMGEVWSAVQHSGPDPLYLTPPRTTWNVGYTLTLGRSAVTTALPAPQVRDGLLVIRLPHGQPGPLSVAGEFNGWLPLAMQEVGGVWEISIPVDTGVTRFAFVDASGTWFVPEGYPGRISDDMGGFVAVVVVP